MKRRTKVHVVGWILALTISNIAGACTNRPTAARGSIDGEFLAKANEICKAAVASRENRPAFPLKDFDPEAPDPESLPIVAAYFEEWGDSEQMARDLNDLGGPRSGKSGWQRLMRLAESIATSSETQISAAKLKDVAAFKRTVKEGAELREEIGTVGSSAGFSTSSACAKYFG